MKISEYMDATAAPARATNTPGPWHVAATSRIIEVVSEFGEVAIVYGGGSPDDETLPNASLLAAAPDLLDALKHALGWVPHQYTDTRCDQCISSCDRCRIHAAIQKAEGRS